MTEIKLNEAALAAAWEPWRQFNLGPHIPETFKRAIRAYLSADPDRAARDAVVEAARELDRAYIALDALQARGQAVPILNAHMSRIQDTKRALRAAVDALPKEGE